MATLRTEEEKSAILAHCLELERTGGDILGYLWSQNYLTPRATWCNYQREWLGRKPYEFTDGKPKKGRSEMARNSIVTDEIREAAVKAFLAGGSPCRILKDAGCKNPGSAWNNIKMKLEKYNPEIAMKIASANGKRGPKQKKQLQLEAGADYNISVQDAMDGMKDAAEEFFGKCEEAGLMKDEPKITVPLMHSGKKAIGWQGDFGTYIYDVKHGYIDYESNDGEELSMPVEAWRNFLAEIREIGLLMGVEL